MKKAAQIVFRRLTAADFFNINKPRGSEARGGGQSYIDFPTSAVRLVDWENFFSGEKTIQTSSGPLWRFTVHSLGLGKSQTAEIGRRRDASFNIRAQKLGTKASNRLFAWHPQYSGFPSPADPTSRSGVPSHLVIYLVRTIEGEHWAGWFEAAGPKPGWQVDKSLAPMFAQNDGNIYLEPAIDFDEDDGNWPFKMIGIASPKSGEVQKLAPVVPSAAKAKMVTGPATKSPAPFRPKLEEEIIADLFADDFASDSVPEKKQVLVNVLKRDQKIVGALKALYKGNCQLTGDKFVFKKTDGQIYCEAHHLLSLGSGGEDSPYNLIIVSPLIHRMFHYANVSGLDLGKIVDNKLEIKINGEPFTITWHPKHAPLVNEAAPNAPKKN